MRVNVHRLDALAIDDDLASTRLGLSGWGDAQVAIGKDEAGDCCGCRLQKIPAAGPMIAGSLS